MNSVLVADVLDGAVRAALGGRQRGRGDGLRVAGLLRSRAGTLGHLAQRRGEIGQLAVQVVDPETLVEPIDRDAVGEVADGLDAVETMLLDAQLAVVA